MEGHTSIFGRTKFRGKIQMRKSKQVIVWRKDLKVSLGKFASQVGHAVIANFINLSKEQKEEYIKSLGENIAFPAIYDPSKEFTFSYQEGDPLDYWLNTSFPKIVVEVYSEQELLDIHEKAKAAGLLACLIKDNGNTEFNGVPTHTCVGIGPNWNEDIDAITGHLKLLKTL